MNDKEQKNSMTEFTIDPLKYLGRDLRELSDEEIETIINNYGTLRDTADGYNLGQVAMALKAARYNVKQFPSFQEMLDDSELWIFLGSKATQAENQPGKNTQKP